MKRLMQYHIVSGLSIETRRSYLPENREKKRRRGTRIAGNTSMKKILANEREAVKRAARILNVNFYKGFVFVTLKYSDSRLPADYEAARKVCERYLRAARAEHKKQTGETLKYFAVTANWSPKRQAPARLHHHIVMDFASLDMLSALWPEGEFYVLRVNNPGNLIRLASYLVANVVGLEKGKKKWSTSKNLCKPIFTEPVEVDEAEGIEPLQGCFVIDAQPTYDEDGRVVGSWMLAQADEPPKVRGSMVILPKKPRKRRKENEAFLDEIRNEDE